MLLCHGSNVEAPQPKILVPARALDFGPRLYVATSIAQAECWSVLTTRRRRGSGAPTLSCFEFDESRSNDLSILSVAKPSSEWLHFVAQNRRDEYRGPRYDLVIGPVANDRTMAVIGDIMANNIDEQAAACTTSTYRTRCSPTLRESSGESVHRRQRVRARLDPRRPSQRCGHGNARTPMVKGRCPRGRAGLLPYRRTLDGRERSGSGGRRAPWSWRRSSRPPEGSGHRGRGRVTGTRGSLTYAALPWRAHDTPRLEALAS